MSHGLITIRRAKRTDLPALAPLLSLLSADNTDKKYTQHWRRLANDPAHDFYVAEQQGTLQGMVLVSYVRTLVHMGWLAILDLALTPPAPKDVSFELIDFAKARARKRGCLHLVVYIDTNNHPMPLTPLFETGFLRTGEVLSCPLQETP
jgi:N-acetylglutamate synthase-like GNAT family acetyltransferase